MNDDSLLGLVLTGRAEIHLMMGDAALADAELQAAEQAYQRVQFRSGLAEVWRVRAGVARVRHDIAGAVRLLKEAAESARTHATAEVLSATERDLGAALEAAGDTAGARAARERALAIFRRLGAADEIHALEALLA